MGIVNTVFITLDILGRKFVVRTTASVIPNRRFSATADTVNINVQQAESRNCLFVSTLT